MKPEENGDLQIEGGLKAPQPDIKKKLQAEQYAAIVFDEGGTTLSIRSKTPGFFLIQKFVGTEHPETLKELSYENINEFESNCLSATTEFNAIVTEYEKEGHERYDPLNPVDSAFAEVFGGSAAFKREVANTMFRVLDAREKDNW